jgi:hypothetical protein
MLPRIVRCWIVSDGYPLFRKEFFHRSFYAVFDRHQYRNTNSYGDEMDQPGMPTDNFPQVRDQYMFCETEDKDDKASKSRIYSAFLYDNCDIKEMELDNRDRNHR